MVKPEIIMGSVEGAHNQNLDAAAKRLEQGRQFEDLSTICVIPTRGMISARAVETWLSLSWPMNQKHLRMFVSGMEVGAAYSAAVETILASPDLSKWKYMLTLEEDNLPPPDGLLRLCESIVAHPKMAAISGLYWTKGPEGQPMIYGDMSKPQNFLPQVPKQDTVQPCWGIGMGFSLWRIEAFKDPKVEKPYFRTVQDGLNAGTQDLDACKRFGELGWKFAVDTRVKVGHYDSDGGIVW